jgi:ABC transport system ATP-binding/permease protein
MRDFLFAPEQAHTPLRALSGGERGRLMLARALARPSNLLVLDEPTNDLDLETLDVLQEMLGDYQGTVILISHDRDFLDRVVNAVIAPEGNGRWLEYAGGYSDMLAQRGADLAAKAPSKPKPAKPAETRPAASEPATPKKKLSFNEKHALDTLPKQIETLKQQIAALQLRFDDPGLYARDPHEFAKVSEALVTAQAELSAAEEKWLALEILREEIEG